MILDPKSSREVVGGEPRVSERGAVVPPDTKPLGLLYPRTPP
jgi:hypothetical protein